MTSRAVEMLRERLGDGLLRADVDRGDTLITVRGCDIVAALTALRDAPDLRYRMLVDLSAIDYGPGGRTPRFDVVYSLLSLDHAARLRLVVGVEEGAETVPTVTDVFPGANWLEREVFDLMGISFEGHPNLKRIELPEDYDGHPLRKEFPVRGGHRQVRQEHDPEPRFGHRYRVR